MSARTARKWLRTVRRDLNTAWTAGRGPRGELENAAYFVQQAAEKLVKAALVLVDRSPRRTHDLATLTAELPDSLPLRAGLLRLRRLSPLGVEYRYPDYPNPDPVPTQPDIDR
jgi:HEPN domain-containing protein